MQRFLLIFLSATLLVGCAKTPETNPLPSSSTDAGPVKVTAVFYPLTFLAEAVGGANVNVTTIVPSGAEPHEYEPTPKQIADLSKTSIFIFHGAGIDPWTSDVISGLEKNGVRIVSAVSGISLISEGNQEVASPKNRMATDPHVWIDPVLLKTIAGHIRDALIAVDPAHQTEYLANETTLEAQLDTIDEEYRSTLGANCRLREVIVSHDAFEYLGKRYNIKILPITGLSPESEPSPTNIAALANLIKAKNIKFVTFETLVSPKLAQTLATETGATTLVLNPLEGLTLEEQQSGKNLLTLMRENLQTLAKAMECRGNIPN